MQKKLIRSQHPKKSLFGANNGLSQYCVPQEVIKVLLQDKEYEPVDQSNLSFDELFNHMEKLFEQCVGEKEITFAELTASLMELLANNTQLPFVHKINEYRLTEDSLVMLLRFCHKFINLDETEMDLRDIAEVFDHHSDFTHHKRLLKNREHKLITEGIIENSFSDGFSDRESFKLSDTARKELFADVKIKTTINRRDIIQATSIQKKELFYNEKEADQIVRLTSLLGEKAFTEIQKRLQENNMRTGFACLFSGTPGTGKTESVYQLARITKRDIIMVDISQIKSMWFGESEKKIKEIFSKYRSIVDEAEITPILFINEADAVIGKRKDISSSSVAQTENTIQNIILQELENLKGIFIATTNLTENLDKAFERRFLYKIDFQKPTLSIQQSIWKSMLPSLSDDEAKILSSRFNFSGGQIENVSRKRTIEFVLSGIEPPLEKLISFCEEEKLNKESSFKIGFGSDKD